ncbi:BrnT family toxin [Parasphingorhabdus sp.]|uniref:BrnT family toxin n=1 Tax=Parasphingorhabdus sp. TaxID=2709688 RepID=UPI003A91BE8A
MKITFDPAKRQWTLEHRGLDFRDASLVFAGDFVELLDDRKDYGEIRYRVFGKLNGRWVAIIWTPRGRSRRIISMMYAHDEEIERNR